MSGSAVNGKDYQTLPGRVLIRAGQTSAAITVLPIDDSEDETNETVVIAIESNSSSPYTVGRPGSGSTTIVDDDDVRIIDATFAPDTVVGGHSKDLRITMSGAAPAGGLAVRVRSGNSGIVSDGQATIPAGTRVGVATLSTSAVTSAVTVPVTAVEPNGSSASTSLVVVTEPSVESVRFRGSILLGGESTSGEVRLTALAPAGGITIPIALSSTGLSPTAIPASAPASVTVAAGGRYGTFTVDTQPVTTSTEVQVMAGTGPTPATTTLQLHPVPQVERFVVSPDPVASGDSVTARVYLDTQYLGGTTFALEIEGTGPVVVPPFTAARFSRYDQGARVRLGVASVADTTVAQLSLQSGGSTAALVARFRVAPPSVTAIRFRGSRIGGGQSTTGEVRLSADAPASGLTLPITLSSPAGGPVPATAPASVTVAPGSDRGFLTVDTQPVTSVTPVPVEVTVGQGPGAATTTIEIAQVPAIQTVTVGPDPVEGGDTVTVRVQMDVRNWLGTTLALRVSGSGPVDIPPNTAILVRYGEDSGRIRLGTSGVATPTTATINVGTDPAQPGPGIASVTINPEPPAVLPPTITATTATPSNAIGGSVIELSVTLSRPADAGGFTAALSSTDPAIVPSSTIQIPAGQRTGFARVRTAAVPAQRSVRMGGPGAPAADITLRVLPLDRIQTPGSVRGGTVVNAEVRLTEPAPAGGLRVPLASSDAAVATVPAFVDVPAGNTSATVPIQTRAGPTDAQITITAGTGAGAVIREFHVRS